METITIYTTSWCPYCVRAKKLLDQKSLSYTEIDVSEHEARAQMAVLTSGRTVPQILIHGHPIGGCDELYELERSGRMDKLLSE